MDEFVLRAQTDHDVQSFDFSLLDTPVLADRLFALGLLMHVSVSNQQSFSQQLLQTLSKAAASSDYPEPVKHACLGKFLKEVTRLEMTGIRVNAEEMTACFDVIETWIASSTPQFGETIKELFSEAITCLLTYVKRLPFTIRLARFAITHSNLLQNREGVLELSKEEFEAMTECEGKRTDEVLAAAGKAYGLAETLAQSQSRLPLTELVAWAIVKLLSVQDSSVGLDTVANFLKPRSSVFTLTQKEAILAAYVKAAEACSTSPNPQVSSLFGKSSAVLQYEEAEKHSGPTVPNKTREFLTYLQTCKGQGYVDVSTVAAQWRTTLLLGEGVVAHRKAAPEFVDQLIVALQADRKAHRKGLWRLVLSCLNEMGFKTVENYRQLKNCVGEFLDEENQTPGNGRTDR